MVLVRKETTMLSPRTTKSDDVASANGRVVDLRGSIEDRHRHEEQTLACPPLIGLSPLPHSHQSSESFTVTIAQTCEPARTSTTCISDFPAAPSPLSKPEATVLDSAGRLPEDYNLRSPAMQSRLSHDDDVNAEAMDLDPCVASRLTDQIDGASDGLIRSRLNFVTTHLQRELLSSSSNLFGSTHMPNNLMWMVVISIGVLVGLVNYMMVFFGEKIVDWKFETIKNVAKTHGAAGALLLPLFAVISCFITSMMVCIWAPMVAGSGLPEIKGYLNGCAMPGLLETRKHWIRIVGIMLTVAAGMPIGREGPMVCIGGSCGILVVQQILKPWFVRRVQVKSDLDGHCKRLKVLDEENYAHLKRVACTLGASCGIAVSFRAPIGGVLYMIEEVAGVFKWTPQITFQAFVSTVTAVLVSTGLLEISPYEFHQLVLFRPPTTKDMQVWTALDIVFIIFMGTACGFLSAFFTSMKIKIWKLRKAWIWRRRRTFRVLEVSIFALIVGLAWAYAPLILSCEPLPVASTVTPHVNALRRSLSHYDSRDFVNYECSEEHPEHYRELASLWWAGEEEAVVHLYASGDSLMRIEATAVALLVYVPLAMAMAGLALPMGMFIPNLFMGACVGRCLGEALKLGGFKVAKPGVYAFIGSGAMLGGFTHMTIAIVALLVEVTEDLSAILPLVVGVAVGRFVSQIFHHHPYDEQLVLLKNVPLLTADLPSCIDSHVETKQITRPLTKHVYLKPMMKAADILQLLEREPSMTYFPVRDSDGFIGTCSRGRMEDVVIRCKSSEMWDDDAPVEGPHRCRWRSGKNATRLSGSVSPKSQHNIVPVKRMMDPKPFCVFECMPVLKLYALFVNCGLHCACVLGNSGELVGLITRADLHSTIERLRSGRGTRRRTTLDEHRYFPSGRSVSDDRA